MAKMTVSGPEEYALQLSALGDAAQGIAKKMVYNGAKVVSDAIKSQLSGLSTVSDQKNIAAWRKGEKTSLSDRQKQGLIESFGIAKMRNDGGIIYAKIGFDGYNEVKTKKYPKGQPNQLVARLLESGSSYFVASPFIMPAVNKSKNDAIQAMKLVMDEEVRKKVK